MKSPTGAPPGAPSGGGRGIRVLSEEELARIRGGGPGVKPGILARDLGGTEPIPPRTNLALGFSKTLDAFAKARSAVSVEGAWVSKYIQVPIGLFKDLKSYFHAITDSFIQGGGRIQFDLTGIRVGLEGATTWELREILKTGGKLFQSTDFWKNGVKLSGKQLEEALKPWR